MSHRGVESHADQVFCDEQEAQQRQNPGIPTAAESWKDRIAADFLIGGHASVQCERLLTRDRGFYRNILPLAVEVAERQHDDMTG
jgi:predicted nucleic acid-binding protein